VPSPTAVPLPSAGTTETPWPCLQATERTRGVLGDTAAPWLQEITELFKLLQLRSGEKKKNPNFSLAIFTQFHRTERPQYF